MQQSQNTTTEKLKTCVQCNGPIEKAGKGGSNLCSEKCRADRIAHRRYLHQVKKSMEMTGEDGVDFVTCEMCGIRGQHLLPHLKHHHKMTVAEYLEMYPNAKSQCEVFIKKSTKSSGLHMKRDEFRKMSSERIKGDKNPMSKANASEQKRKETSPFSMEFWKKRFPEATVEELESMRKAKIKDFLKDRVSDTTLEYYTDRGMSEEEAVVALRDRQTTFSLDKCIAKHGEEEGLKVWTERQEKWKEKVFNSETHLGGGRSKVSEKFINLIMELVDDPSSFLSGKSEKFIVDSSTKMTYKFDLCSSKNRKIIEFNGDFWHSNPNIFEPNYFHKIKKKTAKEIWEYDTAKIAVANKYGYEVLTVWEGDFYKDPDAVVQKCLDFLSA